MDQRSFGKDKIIQSGSCDKDVAEERTLVTEEVKDVVDKTPEDLGKNVFDDIPEKVEDDGTSMEDNYFVHDVAKMVVNLPSKVGTDTDSRQLKLPNTFVVEKDEISDVITRHEAKAKFNPDFVRMFKIRHESYIFMTAWSCFRRLVPQFQVKIYLTDIYA